MTVCNCIIILPQVKNFCNITGAVKSNKSSDSTMDNVRTGSVVAGSASGGQREAQNDTLTAEELRKRRQAYFDRWV